MVQSQQFAEFASLCPEDDGLVGEEEILDIDRAELMLAADVGLDTDSDDGLDLEIHEPNPRPGATRPVSGYRLTD